MACGRKEDGRAQLTIGLSQRRARIGIDQQLRRIVEGLIIFTIAALYSPLKLFLTVPAAFFITGATYYAYTYVTMGRFTNMSVLLFSAAVIVFLIGLISEQITSLTYQAVRGERRSYDPPSE